MILKCLFEDCLTEAVNRFILNLIMLSFFSTLCSECLIVLLPTGELILKHFDPLLNSRLVIVQLNLVTKESQLSLSEFVHVSLKLFILNLIKVLKLAVNSSDCLLKC